MTFLETISFMYIVVATLICTLAAGYFAFCGIRQYVDDARTGAAYRVEDQKFTEMAKRGIPTIVR